MEPEIGDVVASRASSDAAAFGIERRAQESRRRPVDIDRAAWYLIRRFGDGCAVAAYRRAATCAQHGAHRRAAEWRLVLQRVVALHFAPPSGATF